MLNKLSANFNCIAYNELNEFYGRRWFHFLAIISLFK